MSKIREQTTFYRLHAKTPEFGRRVRITISFLQRRLEASCCVGFSAGKDSAVVAHLCQAQLPGIPILMVDPGVPTHWEEAERQAWLDYAKANAWHLIIMPWDKWCGQTSQETEAAYQSAVHRDMFADMNAYRAKTGLTTLVWGLRSDEACARRAYMQYKGRDYTRKDGMRTLSPIADWSTDDIWAYILTHDLPWLRIYDVLGPDARNGMIGRNGENNGRLVYLRHHFPKAYLWARDMARLEFVQ